MSQHNYEAMRTTTGCSAARWDIPPSLLPSLIPLLPVLGLVIPVAAAVDSEAVDRHVRDAQSV